MASEEAARGPVETWAGNRDESAAHSGDVPRVRKLGFYRLVKLDYRSLRASARQALSTL